jgi:hypothetical protein
MSPENKDSENSQTFLIVEFRQFKKKYEYATGIVRNPSKKGFTLESQNCDFKHGEILELKIKHPRRDLSATALGEIIWIKKGWYKYAAGINLKELDKENESKFLELISESGDMSITPILDDKIEKALSGHNAENNGEDQLTDQKEEPIKEPIQKDDKDMSEHLEVSSVENASQNDLMSDSIHDKVEDKTETNEQTEIPNAEESPVTIPESSAPVHDIVNKTEKENQKETFNSDDPSVTVSETSIPAITSTELSSSPDEAFTGKQQEKANPADSPIAGAELYEPTVEVTDGTEITEQSETTETENSSVSEPDSSSLVDEVINETETAKPIETPITNYSPATVPGASNAVEDIVDKTEPAEIHKASTIKDSSSATSASESNVDKAVNKTKTRVGIKEAKRKRKKKHSYIPLVTALVIVSSVIAFIKSKNIKEVLITHIASTKTVPMLVLTIRLFRSCLSSQKQ